VFGLYQVLLLEDGAEAAEIILRNPDKFNFSVTWVENGQLGLTRLKQRKFDLILSDIMMPGIDGFSFLERGGELIGRTPVIITSALGGREQVVRASALNVQGYLVKPITQRALIEKICSALNITFQDLIHKKEHPLSLEETILSEEQIKIRFAGIPDLSSGEKFARALAQMKSRYPELKEIVLEVPKEFCFEHASLDFLERAMLSVQKVMRIKPASVSLSGTYWFHVKRENLARQRMLGQCNLLQ